VGHAPRSITARHYIPRLSSASIGEAVQLEESMILFRRLVVEHIETAIREAAGVADVRTIGGVK
jgi:hypothetical protein